MKQIKQAIVTALAVSIIPAAVSAAELVASKEPGWPQWRGPRSDGVSDEKGLLKSWPEGGPKLLWKSDGLGKGHSSPIISQGMIYITGDEGEKLNISALDLEGKLKWKVQNGESWKKSFPGSRSSCSYSDGLVYQMNAHGRLVCLDAKDGAERWSTSILERYVSKNITWGISESPLLADGKVFVTPAGEKALMVALDARSGSELWKADPLEGEMPTYSSAIMLDTGTGRQLITGGSAHTFGVDAASGKVLWKYRHEIEKPVMLSPSYSEGNVVVSICVRTNACYYALELDQAENQVKMKWKNEIGNPFGGTTCADGNVLCSSMRNENGWFCIDAETGRIKSKAEDLISGSSTYADGLFYGLCSNGKMTLLKATDDVLQTISEFDFKTGKKDVWAYPVICDGRLYLRYDDTLYCYDVKNP